MKVIHVNGYFSDDMMYQENYLMKALGKLGHKAYLFTGRFEPKFEFNQNDRVKGTGCYRYENSVIVRLPEIFEIINAIVFFVPFGGLLRRIRPDVIFFHGISPNIIYGLLYKLFNPKVKLHLDFHTTYSNSGNSKFSKVFHTSCKLFSMLFIRFFERVFCVAPECKTFAHEMYAIPNEKLEILPLPSIKIEKREHDLKREEFRNSHGLKNEICFVHTGKMPEDKETLLVLKTFTANKNPNLRLFMSGTCDNDFKLIIDSFIQKDPRIMFLGWLNYEQFTKMLCGCEIMIQPGSLSQVFVDAICCGKPLILDNTPQGEYLTSFGNGFLTERSQSELSKVMEQALLELKEGNLREQTQMAADFFDYINITKFSLDKNHISKG